MSALPQLAGHLVIRAPNWVGDLVMATPVLEAAVADGGLYERVTMLVREHLAPVLAGGLVEAHVRTLAKAADETALYRALDADVALLLSSSFGAALRASRARVPVRIGVSLHRRGLLLTHKLVPARYRGRRVATPTANLLRDVGALAGLLPPSVHPVLHVTSDEEARAAELRVAAGLATDEPYIVCCPGAAFGAAKLWPPPRFAEVIEQLFARYGWRTLVTGGPGEERLMDAVAAAAPAAVSLSAELRDLGSLKALVRDARLLFVGDSGPRWYAAAFDTPCVSIMGPNLPELTATSLEWCEIVRKEDLACSPCLERACPLEHHACMVGLPSAAVVAAAERVLERA
jgi:heptosyltransferase-2